VADPFEDAFDQLGADFEALVPGLKPVTVESVDPDTGAALVTAADVPALKRGRRRYPFAVAGGELGGDRTRFLFKAARIDATLKAKDRVTEADGTVWTVDERGAELIAFGQIWALNVTLKRG
jgi:hypothetical protein